MVLHSLTCLLQKAPEPKVELVAADQSDDEDFRGKKRVDSSDEADSDFVL